MDTWTIVFALFVGVLGIYYYYFRILSHFRDLGIPYMKPVPVFGSMASVILQRESAAEVIENAYKLHSNSLYIGIFDQHTPIIMLCDPDLIKSIMVKNFDYFTDHQGFVPDESDVLFSNNLFALRGDRWRESRAMLSPAFTSSKMKAMFKLMSECASRYGHYIARLPSEKRDMDVKDTFTRYTNDMIATCAFGIEVNSMDNPKNDFYVYGREASDFSGLNNLKFFLLRCAPRLMRLLNVRLASQRIEKFFTDLVSSTIKARDERGIYRPDMIQLMMETRGKGGRELTIEEMTSHAFFFFFGGFESTSTLMSFAAYLLAIEPEVQARAREEVDGMLEETRGEFTYDGVNGLEYLEAVLNETMRMYPVVVALDRVCVKSFELPPALPGLKPYNLKTGQDLWIPVYALHRDPKHFENPEKFEPDRFLGEGKKIVNSGIFLPFGFGPRMCIGNRFAMLETKVLLAHLLARCELKRCAKTRVPIKMKKSAVTMMPEGGYWIRIEPRSEPGPFIAKHDATMS